MEIYRDSGNPYVMQIVDEAEDQGGWDWELFLVPLNMTAVQCLWYGCGDGVVQRWSEIEPAEAARVAWNSCGWQSWPDEECDNGHAVAQYLRDRLRRGRVFNADDFLVRVPVEGDTGLYDNAGMDGCYVDENGDPLCPEISTHSVNWFAPPGATAACQALVNERGMDENWCVGILGAGDGAHFRPGESHETSYLNNDCGCGCNYGFHCPAAARDLEYLQLHLSNNLFLCANRSHQISAAVRRFTASLRDRDPLCDNNCTRAACGNGFVGNDANGEPEGCDDGNLVDGDGCSSNCQTEACGNGVVGNDANGDPEECDDGNLINGDGCDSNCTWPRCGNGVTALDQNGEEEACGDGNDLRALRHPKQRWKEAHNAKSIS
jgi:cysteine-rich repeat protein